MNKNAALAMLQKRQMQLRATISGSNNPYHAQHIQEFCDYTDKAVAAMGQSILEALPALIRAEIATKDIEIKVEEKSYQTAKRKIAELFQSIWR